MHTLRALISRLLGFLEAYLKDMGMAGLASAWAMARQRTKEYRHAAPAYVPIPDLA